MTCPNDPSIADAEMKKLMVPIIPKWQYQIDQMYEEIANILLRIEDKERIIKRYSL